MKICHVITRLILGGAQENTILTCEGLARRGHDVTLLTGPAIGPEGQLFDRADRGDYDVEVIPAMRREINPWRDWRAYRQLLQRLRQIRPDVVHTHSSKAGILGRRAAARSGEAKVVHTIHGLPFHPHQSRLLHRFYVACERRAARWTDAYISVADAMTAEALAAGVGRADMFTTVYSGMEAEKFLNRPAPADEFRRSLKLPDDAVLVTQVSRLAKLKGHEFIIAAAGLITNPRVYFCFVGDGRLREQIESQIHRRGLQDKFRITGLLPPEMMPAVMHASDVVIHCSLHEGLARTIPQAMLAARPVISFDTDGAPEVVDENTGVLVPPGDIDALAAAIGKLAGDRRLRDKLGSAGRARCREIFDHHRMVEQIENVYLRLLS